MVQARYDVNRKHKIPTADIEHFELSVCVGLLVNSVPATAWALYYIYSQPSLLEEIRDTLSSYVHCSPDACDGRTYRLNIAQVVTGCPLLASLVQETLGVQSTNASGRVVLKDILLEDRYLLKKGSILLVPSTELHNNASVWGPSREEFDPRRFLSKASTTPASAYRAFGGGASVCPGRFLATNEILSVIIALLLRYDMRPVDGIWIPPKSRPHITTSVLTPVEDIKVSITERKDHENGKWEYSWTA